MCEFFFKVCMKHTHIYGVCFIQTLNGGKTAMKGEDSSSWPCVEKTLIVLVPVASAMPGIHRYCLALGSFCLMARDI